MNSWAGNDEQLNEQLGREWWTFEWTAGQGMMNNWMNSWAGNDEQLNEQLGREWWTIEWTAGQGMMNNWMNSWAGNDEQLNEQLGREWWTIEWTAGQGMMNNWMNSWAGNDEQLNEQLGRARSYIWSIIDDWTHLSFLLNQRSSVWPRCFVARDSHHLGVAPRCDWREIWKNCPHLERFVKPGLLHCTGPSSSASWRVMSGMSGSSCSGKPSRTTDARDGGVLTQKPQTSIFHCQLMGSVKTNTSLVTVVISGLLHLHLVPNIDCFTYTQYSH